MHSDRLSIRVDDELQRDLQALARETGQSESDVVREALRRHVRTRRRGRYESAYDVAKRLGVVGSEKGLPRTLSTNPKHLKGFGK